MASKQYYYLDKLQEHWKKDGKEFNCISVLQRVNRLINNSYLQDYFREFNSDFSALLRAVVKFEIYNKIWDFDEEDWIPVREFFNGREPD